MRSTRGTYTVILNMNFPRMKMVYTDRIRRQRGWDPLAIRRPTPNLRAL